MTKTRKILVSLSVAAITLSGTAAAAAHPRSSSITGRAELDTRDPLTTFEFTIHAEGNGRTGEGVVWMAHHVSGEIGWLVARVDCVRVDGATATVTGVVTDAGDFTGAGPGDPISLTVRDNGTKDVIAFGSREQVQRKCQAAAGRSAEITRGDFRLGR